MHSTSDDDIIQACNAFYNEEYMWKEKERFFKAIGKKTIHGRNNDRKIKELDDILSEMQTRCSVQSQKTMLTIKINNAVEKFFSVFRADKLHLNKWTHEYFVSSFEIDLITAINMVSI